MKARASTVGELAARVLARGGFGVVTRVFPGSVYLKSRGDFVVLLWGSLRSPLTVNVVGGKGTIRLPPGTSCSLSKGGISADTVMIDVEGAEVFRSSLRKAGQPSLPTASRLAWSVSALRSMYDVAPEGPKLLSDRAFHEFVDAVVIPLARGERSATYNFGPYRGLVGRGVGFTPAGDDFIGGFAAVYNFAARFRGWRRISFPKSLSSMTIPESAAILSNAANGYVDEVTERLILKSSAGGGGPFHRELFAVLRRGHTSGMDISLGVLLCEAALRNADEGGDVLMRCLNALWNP